MAVLVEGDRVDVWAKFMRHNEEPFGNLTKQDLRAAVDALDNFLETNAATINSAIPLPARTALTVPQKAKLLGYVVRKRWGGPI